MKKIISLLLVTLLLFSFAGCSIEPKDKTFSAEGMEITLTELFTEVEMDGYTVCYGSPTVSVFVLKESYSATPEFEDMSLEEYADLVFKANASKLPQAVTQVDGLTTMEYSFYNEDEDVTYKYFSTMFKGADAFWLIQFVSVQTVYESNKPRFIEWAKTVTFSEN